MLRRIARPLLASVFVVDGLRAAARPQEELHHLPFAEDALGKAAERIPLPVSPDLLVRALGVAKVGAGVALGFGIAPRVAAGLLALLHTPTMLSRHPFWTETGARRREELGGLVRDAAILGGLLLAVSDTNGKPSLAWRAEHATEQARRDAAKAAKHVAKDAKHVAKDAKRLTKHAAEEVKRSARQAAKDAKRAARSATKTVVTTAERDAAKLEAAAERTARRASRSVHKTTKRIEKDLHAAQANVESTFDHAVKDVVEGAKGIKEKAQAALPV